MNVTDSVPLQPAAPAVLDRARESRGSSSEAIYKMVAEVLRRRRAKGGTLIDVGCGRGELWAHVGASLDNYIGADVIDYGDFPPKGRFLKIDLDLGRVPLPDASGDVVAAVETIEHLENPRSFFRELVRLAKPGGLVLVTTPNQRSLLSLATLIVKGEFNAFQEAPGLYPSHITPLLEIDLIRVARECGLGEIEVAYSNHGRIPFSSRAWPASLGFRARWWSDNLALSAYRKGTTTESSPE
jgi:SAM-dependent methyltransferase